MPLDATEDPRIALGRDPVPGASAAGSDARDRPEFETLDTEIRRMESGGANAADWKAVIQAATVILRDQSKDLLVAAYLAYALFRQERLHGLALGLSILRDVTLLYWPEAHPPARRLRGRVAIYEWLNTRLAEALAALGDASEVSADAIAARDALTTTDAFLSETLGAAAPSLGELMRAIRPLAARAEAAAALVAQQAAATLARQETAAAPAAQAAVAHTSAPPPTAAAGPAGPTVQPQPQPQPQPGAGAAALPAPPPLPEDLARSLSPLREWLRKAGLALLAANVLDPRAYGLLAQATWLPLDALPAQKGGRTELPPPAPERLGDLLSRRGGDPKEFLLAVAGFCSGPGLFWLDGQYAISQSLAAMGAAAEVAAKAHDDAMRLCLSPFPGLTGLAFADGTPFLGDAGRAWLDPLLSGAAAGGSPGGGGPQPWVSGAIAAQELMTLNKPDEAFAILTEGARAATGQVRAHWLAEGLRLALRTNDLALALALARRLTALVAAHRLDEWDAAFAAEILELAVRCLALPEIGRFVTPPERTLLMTDWATSLSGLDITRGRDAIKTFAILT